MRARFGFAPVERYGLTETVINTSNPLRGQQKAGSVGLPLPGVEVGVFDPETRRALDNDQTGELWVRGPNVFSGYWQDAEATAAAFDGDWFRTGDLGAVSDRRLCVDSGPDEGADHRRRHQCHPRRG